MIRPFGGESAPFFDLHTHILPGVDDGSKSSAQSVLMLEQMERQGVGFVAATPHYYAAVQSPEAFFTARDEAWLRLREEAICARFDIRLGAEVQYYEGITRLKEPERFCMEGTRLFLLEMPFVPWTERMLSDVRELSETRTLQVMIAHIERYLPFQSRRSLQALMSMDVLLQCNAEFFLSHRTRHRALRMMRYGQIHAIGSDCHNTGSRAPNVGKAMELIEKRVGGLPEFLRCQRELCGGGGDLI